MIRKAILPACLLCMGSLLISCKKEKGDPKETLASIMKADNSGNLVEVLSLYTNDARLMPAGRPDISGIDSIRENYRNIFAGSKLSLTGYADETTQSNDLAMIRGRTEGIVFSLKDSSTIQVHDKFIMILKYIEGKWKIHRLMWGMN
ncbi:MAG TPA: nuclear transport factor 2 family protein [Chitinophagaceae bacterium]|nr:nuclear transport factor 2 family protein [Chitinophagaceae bacterium]